MINIIKIDARDLPDLWFQALYNVLKEGRTFKIDRGSYAGQTRIEFDYFIGHVTHPSTIPLLPEMPPGCDIPAPVEEAYVFGGKGYDRSYIEYLMTGEKEPGESYTYGERLTSQKLSIDEIKFREGPDFDEDIMNKWLVNYEGSRHSIFWNKNDHQTNIYLNQIEWIIDTYKKHGHRNNQMVLQVAQPTDTLLVDPPCLRHIDTRIQDNKLHFFVYFRSWDLWGGLPANLAAIQTLKEYMASCIGVEDGEMVVESKGLHLYGYAEKLAKIRCMVNDYV